MSCDHAPVLPGPPARRWPSATRLRLVARLAATTVRRVARTSVAVLGVVTATGLVLTVLLIEPAQAHATLEGSDPGPDSTVAKVPARVTLRFDEPVTALAGSLRVYAPDGSRVDDGHLSHPDADGARLAVGLDAAGRRGTYLVSWRIVSADSHPVSGAFTFSVGRSTAAPSITTAGTDRTVSVLMGASRWLGYLGSALLLGGLVFIWWCWPRGRLDRRAGRLVLAGTATALVSVASGLLLDGPYDAGLGVGAITHGSLLTEVVDSGFGRALLARAGLVLLLTELTNAVRRTVRPPRAPLAVTAGLVSVGYLITFAFAGHAATSDHRGWTVASDALHVGAMSVWVGGLLMILTVAEARTREALLRFSALATVCVLVLVATGVYQSWLNVGSWAALPATGYGRELLVKTGLVALLLAAAGVSRARLHRPLAVPAATPDTARPMLPPEPPVRRTVLLEAVGAVAVLAITAALVATQPARTAYRPSVDTRIHLGPDIAEVTAVPDGDRRMDLHLSLTDRAGRLVNPPEVDAAVSLPGRSIGPLEITLHRFGTSHFTGTIAVPTPGDWRLAVTVRTTAIDEYTKVVVLPIR